MTRRQETKMNLQPILLGLFIYGLGLTAYLIDMAPSSSRQPADIYFHLAFQFFISFLATIFLYFLQKRRRQQKDR